MTNSFDEILTATKDIANLTPQQIEARLQALNESMEVQQRLFRERFEQ